MDCCLSFLSFMFYIVGWLCVVVFDVSMQGRCSTLFDILQATTCKAEDWSNILPVSVPLTTRLLLRPSQLSERNAPTELVSSCSIYFAMILRSTPLHHPPFFLPQPSSILYPGSKSSPKGKRPNAGKARLRGQLRIWHCETNGGASSAGRLFRGAELWRG